MERKRGTGWLLPAALGLCVALSGAARAGEIPIGTGAGQEYENLEHLRIELLALDPSTTFILGKDDASLTTHLVLANGDQIFRTVAFTGPDGAPRTIQPAATGFGTMNMGGLIAGRNQGAGSFAFSLGNLTLTGGSATGVRGQTGLIVNSGALEIIPPSTIGIHALLNPGPPGDVLFGGGMGGALALISQKDKLPYAPIALKGQSAASRVVFSNNKAVGITHSKDWDNVMYNGVGGAVAHIAIDGANQNVADAASNTILEIRNGNFTFSNNSAAANTSNYSADISFAGLGGAVGSLAAVEFDNGAFRFDGNTARGAGLDVKGPARKSGVAASGSVAVSGLGGAVFGQDAVRLGEYNADPTAMNKNVFSFADNRAVSGAMIGENGIMALTGVGGAVAGMGAVQFAGNDASRFTFSGNAAVGGSLSEKGTAFAISGVGGAVAATITVSAGAAPVYFVSNGGTYRFANNTARGGDNHAETKVLTDPALGALLGKLGLKGNFGFTGMGGAVFAAGRITTDVAGDGTADKGSTQTMTFSNNSAIGSNAAGERSSVYESGVGGAMASAASISLIDGGTYWFTGNSAKGGDASGKDSWMRYAGLGGAMAAGNLLNPAGTGSLESIVLNGDFFFVNNAAAAGAASGDKAKIHLAGLGGALYGNGGLMSITGSGWFENNRASTAAATGPGNLNSNGRGGAIFYDAYNGAGVKGANTVKLAAAAGKKMIFVENRHQNGANSIYFGSTSTTIIDGGATKDTAETTFNVNGAGTVIMYDPIESQMAGMLSHADDKPVYQQVDMRVVKSNAGAWVLGGVSNLYGEDDFKVAEGMFHQFGYDAVLNLAHRESGKVNGVAVGDSTFKIQSMAPTKIAEFRPTVSGIRDGNGGWKHSKVIADKVGIGTKADFIAKFSIGGLASLDANRTDYAFDVIEAKAAGGLAYADPTRFAFAGSTNGVITNYMVKSAEMVNKDGRNQIVQLKAAVKAMDEGFGFSRNATDRAGFFGSAAYTENYAISKLVDNMYNNPFLTTRALVVNSITAAQRTDINTFAGDAVGNLAAANAGIYRANRHTAGRRIDDWNETVGAEDGSLASRDACAMAAFALRLTDPRHRVWAAGFGSRGLMDSDHNVAGFRSDIHGAALGYDLAVTRRFLAGVAVGNAGSKVKSRDGGNVEVKGDSYFAGAYGAARFGRFMAEANLFFGVTDNAMKTRYNSFAAAPTHNGPIATAADFDTEHFGIDLKLAYDFRPGRNTRITPFAGLECYHGRQKAFSESRALLSDGTLMSRSFDAASYDSMRLPVGVRFAHHFRFGSATVTPRLSVAYAREAMDESGEVWARMLGGVTRWRIQGVRPGRDLFLLDAGVAATICRFDVAVNYQLEARRNYVNQGVKVEFGVGF